MPDKKANKKVKKTEDSYEKPEVKKEGELKTITADVPS